jgi:hypothetical protein
MCTLTFATAPGRRIITANRDESPLRHAEEGLTAHVTRGEEYLIAREPLHGGTNFAISRKGVVTTLLNGAFTMHRPSAYHGGRSRGLILLDSLPLPKLSSLALPRGSEGKVQPFTLVRIGNAIEVCRWDGSALHHEQLSPNEPMIWASAQLYSPRAIERRKRWFREVLDGGPSPAALWHMHIKGGDGDPENDMVMNRGGLVRTVTVTQVKIAVNELNIRHLDLLSGAEHHHNWQLDEAD